MESMGSTRDDRKASENRAKQLQQGKAGGVIREYSESDFMERTLPMLNWAKMRDMAIYADQAQGLSGMVAFLQENLEHPRITDFLDELQSLLKDLSASAPPSVTSSVPETPAPPVAVPPAPGVPPGLE